MPKCEKIFTVGHSNRAVEDFIRILREAGVEAVVDVRRFPRSKFEHFNRENLESILKKNGIDYYYLGEKLGGFRKGGYENYTKTEEFEKGIEELIKIAQEKLTAIMCAEKLFFRCHRRFIAKRLEELGFEVIHL
uniref:DUF488 domain-containing protein n=2 Tax=candidate division WOR-3 bacterium TaxID=2052148 RepID=A0A7V3ZZQ5_UNCW3